MRNVVLDTNVLISGIIASGYSAIILDAARRGEIQLVTSPHLIDEFSEVIARRHIARKYPKAAAEAESLVTSSAPLAILWQASPKNKASALIAMTISCWHAQRRGTRTASFPAILISSA